MDRRPMKRGRSVLTASVATVQTGVVSFTQTARRQFPRLVALAHMSAMGCERLGERTSASRAWWLGLVGLAALWLAVDPVAAQVNCNQGMLKFLADIQTLTVESVGIMLLIMVIGAGALKALPMKGTDRWGNAAIGGVMIGTAFYVLGPAVIDLADSATSVDMSAGCNAGGGGN